jgi:hypothetical protein
LKLPTVLEGKDEGDAVGKALVAPPQRRRKRRRETVAEQAEREGDEVHEVFYERMQLTRDFESVVEALYRDFLALRLGGAWETIAAQIRAWATGGDVDEEAYRAVRERVIAASRRRAKAK